MGRNGLQIKIFVSDTGLTAISGRPVFRRRSAAAGRKTA